MTMNLHTVKLFLPSIVEGPGEGRRGEVMLSVMIMAASGAQAKGMVEDAFTRLLQAEIDGDIQRTPSADT